MKALWLAAAGIFISSAGLAHSIRGTCLLGSDCLAVSKIPVTACRVTGKEAKAKDACVIDGMKLIGKLAL